MFKSLSYAVRGIVRVLREERNFRIELGAAAVVIVLMFTFDMTRVERSILALVISAVLVLELMNSVVERFVDILKPRIHHYVEDIKDITAGAVLVAAGCAVAVGLLLFWPHFVTLIGV